MTPAERAHLLKRIAHFKAKEAKCNAALMTRGLSSLGQMRATMGAFGAEAIRRELERLLAQFSPEPKPTEGERGGDPDES
ncbi:MAG: hypothetical protein AB7W59_00380 [Acidimicrobiia bacterium]